MPRATHIPSHLRGRPVTTREAADHGVGRGTLAGPSWTPLFRGVSVTADTVIDAAMWLRAALLVLPAGTVVSHSGAMRLYGLEPRPGRHLRWELSTNRAAVTEHKEIILHRRQRLLRSVLVQGLPATGPERTFVDCALPLSFVELVQLGDHLVHRGFTTIDRLVEFAHTQHLHGVLLARRTVAYVRDRVESPMETLVRLMLVTARLPQPDCNVDIRDAGGRFLARGDLVYLAWKVLVEYDGWQHERDAAQRAHDTRRREKLEAAGWRVVVISVGDLAAPRKIPERVHAALTARGYDGSRPVMSIIWDKRFPTFEGKYR